MKFYYTLCILDRQNTGFKSINIEFKLENISNPKQEIELIRLSKLYS